MDNEYGQICLASEQVTMISRSLISTIILVTVIKTVTSQGYNYDCRRYYDCQNGGTCSLSNGACACAAGYSGYNCQIIDGTTCPTPKVCNNGTCYVDNGVEKCGCDFGFYGDTCVDENIQVTCEGTTAVFSLIFPETFSGSVKLYVSGSDVPSTCNFTSSTADGMTTYSLTVNTEQDSTDTTCGSENILITGDTAGDANYTGQITVRYYDMITTSMDLLFVLTCKHIGGDVDISKQITNIGVNPEGNLTQVVITRPYSPVDFEIVTMAGGVLTESLYVGDSYKICFFLIDTSVYKNVYIKSCTTNNTLDGDNSKTYDIYNEGCPTRKGMTTTTIQEAANKTIDDVTYPSVCLPIRAFKFIDSNNLALTCKVQLCKENDTSCELPTTEECETVIQNEGAATTTVAPDTNTTEATNTNTTESTNSTTDASSNNDNSTTDTSGSNDNSTTSAPTNNDNSTTAAPTNNDNSTTAATGSNDNSTTTESSNNDNSTTGAAGSGNNDTDSTTSAPTGGDGGGTTEANNGATDETTDSGRRRRRRRAADDTEEKTVSTVITVFNGQRISSTDEILGSQTATVEECLSMTEIMAVITVLGSTVLILFIAVFVLVCILIQRKSKLSFFGRDSLTKSDRFQIPRAHINQAYREI